MRVIRLGVGTLFLMVLAACGGGGGGGSGGGSGPQITAPGAPTIGTATPDDGSLTVSFTAPTSNGGGAISAYTVTCAAGSDSKSGTGSTSPVTVTSLTNGTTYTCSVTASNSAGTGAASATVSGTPALQPKPLSITPILGGFTAGATVEIFRADTGERLDVKTLGADGTVTVTVPATFTGLVIVRVSGDSAAQYLDERTDSLKTFSQGQFLLAVVPPGATSSRTTPIAVSALTHAIAITAGVSTSSTANPIGASSLTAAGLQTAQNKVFDNLGLTSVAIDPLKVPVYLKASDRGTGKKLEGSGEPLNHGVLLIAIAKLAPSSVDLARFSDQLGLAIKSNTVGADVPQIAQLPQQVTSVTNSFVSPSSQNQITIAPSPVLVSTSAGVGGAISPLSISARKGTSVSFSLTTSVGYEIATVSGCAGTLTGSTYTTGALGDPCTVSATFKLKTYTVTATAAANGGVSPSSRSVEHGSSTTFTVTPNTGYAISAVTGCGGSLNGATYTTGAITSDCAVSATFIETFNVTALAGLGGSISPASVAAKSGTTTTFTVTPSANYDIDTVSGCSGTLSGNTYTTGAITAACTVNASFKLKKYTVTASAGTGGSISPASASVDHGTTTIFTVTPSANYDIDTVSGCGGTLSGTTYTTGTITAACSVNATFKLKKYTVTASAGTGGSITPTTASIDHGVTTTFSLAPNTGYEISEVSGCGGTLSGNTYTTGAITAACTVNASFKLKKYTVTASAGTGGSISPASASVDHGTTTAFTVTPQSDYVISSVAGCNGSLSGTRYTTGTITAACAVSASFVPKVATSSIAGVWSGVDSARPAFISVSSAADDSFLKVVQLKSDGSFEVTGLDATKTYIVEPEQSGSRPASAIQYATASASNNDDRVFTSATTAENPLAISAKPGTYLSINGVRIPGLTDGEFTYRWEGNPTASGAEYSSYVPNPIRVELLGSATPAADPQASTRLAEEYGIVLVNPDSSSPVDQLPWSTEYAERLLKSLQGTPLPVANQGTRSWTATTQVTLFNREIPADIEKSTDTFMGGRVRLSSSAFTYATPLLARVEGRRGIFFSNRLFRAVIRMVTENGTRRDRVRDMMKQRYGITVATDDNDPLLIVPVTCPQFPSDCLDAEWKVFNPDELFDLLSILEEFPEGLRDFSQPGKPVGLRHLLRRRDGIPHPLYPQAGAVAWPESGYAEFMESGLKGSQSWRHSLIVHEKAHFVWAGLLSSQQRYEWLRQSGWYRVPKLNPGEDVKTIGKCDEWQKNPATWTPPNVSNSDIEFFGAVAHDDNQSDSNSLKKDWASCSTTQFVTTYAASINPNEDFAESFSAFLLNPDLLRSRALPKYEFIRDRLMQGSFYISRIRQDLTFEVFNLYPDYTYPGKIKAVDVRVTGKADEDKRVTVRIEINTSAGCDSSKNSGCFDGASGASLRIFSRLSPPTIRDMYLTPISSAGNILEGSITMSRLAASGWWQLENISMTDKVGNVRVSKQSSKDFGWKLYLNNPGEDLLKPEYVPGSISLKLVGVGDPLASPVISGDERELVTQFRFKEVNAGTCYARTAYADTFSDPAKKIFKGTFDDYGSIQKLDGTQADGATHLCTIRHRVTRFWTSGAYSTVFIFVEDEAGNVKTTNFSQNGDDPTLEKSPSIKIISTNSDGIPPILETGACKTTDEAERCLRVKASPTNPSSPNGETQVDIFYWSYEEPPISNASGLDGGTMVLRDPLGKTFFYYINESVGVVDRRPLRRIDGNYYFTCPKSGSPTPCDAVTPVQYQMRIILPVGSAPGTWGLQEMSVYDKVSNSRGYDFTELFRFTPSGTGDDERVGAASEAGGNPFTFEVAGAGSKPASLTTVMVSTVKSAWTSVIDTISGWASRATAYVSNGVSRAMAWFQGGARMGVGFVRNELASLVPGMAGTAASTLDAAVDRATSAETVVVSMSEDLLTGSRYQIIRQQTDAKDSPQRWTLEYRSNTGALFAAAQLPDTSEVLWRGTTGSHGLSTTGWTRICADRVWSVQDGYQMLFTLADRSLSDVRPGQLWVNSQAEVTVISDVRCAFGGSVWVEGYAFAASDKEPLLRGQRVEASRFGFALDRLGGLSKRQVEPAFFEAPKHCAEPANEQLLFCSEVKTAVGW